tara:strand:- start:1513 stop:2190 length:678 start_codon:yes stop_codon:yes gene_type:complete
MTILTNEPCQDNPVHAAPSLGVNFATNEWEPNGPSACEMWKDNGRCEGGDDFVRSQCPKTCGLESPTCGALSKECKDLSDLCFSYEMQGFCNAPALSSYMGSMCKETCGSCQPPQTKAFWDLPLKKCSTENIFGKDVKEAELKERPCIEEIKVDPNVDCGEDVVNHYPDEYCYPQGCRGCLPHDGTLLPDKNPPFCKNLKVSINLIQPYLIVFCDYQINKKSHSM